MPRAADYDVHDMDTVYLKQPAKICTRDTLKHYKKVLMKILKTS